MRRYLLEQSLEILDDALSGRRQCSWHGRAGSSVVNGRYRLFVVSRTHRVREDNTGYFKGIFSRTGLFLTPLPCRTDFLLAEQKSSGGRSKLFDNSASKLSFCLLNNNICGIINILLGSIRPHTQSQCTNTILWRYVHSLQNRRV